MQQPVYYRLSRTERIPLGARYVDIPDAFVAAFLMACGGFAVAFILFSMVPLDWAGFPSVGRPEVFRFADWYRSLDVAQQASFDLRVSLALVIGFFGLVLGLWVGFQPKQTDEHIGGSQFMDGAAAIKAMRVATDAAIERTGQGIHLHPELPISLDTEVKHFMLVGAPGSGKTQTLHFLLKQLFKRGGKGDKMIIYDTKADFTAAYPQALLIAPWDARSPAWDIAKDCTTEGQARELAARFIADSKEPMWAEGTRAILVSLIVKLQTDNPMRWTWRDLADHIAMASADADLLVSWVQRFNPVQAAVVLGGSESKTVQSFMTTLAASATLIAQLAQAWESKSAKISFTQWLHDENPKYRQIILQGDGRFASLTKAYIGSILTLLSQEICSPVFTDSNERRLWFILDEAPTLGKVDILRMITEGRSKGVRVLACFQDQSQIREIYGDNVAKTWSTSAGTMIIYRVNRGDTANWLAEEIIGTRTVRRNQTSESFTKDGRTVQRSQTEVKLPIVHPSDLENKLGPCDEGVRGLVLGLGVVGRLTWPYMPVKNKREKHKPAQWTLPKQQAMPVDEVVQRLEAAGQAAQAQQEAKTEARTTKVETEVQLKHAIVEPTATNSTSPEQGEESALETVKAVAVNVPVLAEAIHAVELGKAVMNANAQPVGTVAPTFTALPIERLVKEPRGRRETIERGACRMMSIAKLKAGAENYYLSLARATYYNDGGEPAGQWLGRGIQGMGLSGEVEDQPLVNLMQGYDPNTGKPLVQGNKKHVAAWDCTFSAPKSCSIVWALADKELQDRMAAAQQTATAKAVAYLEEQAITRRGKDGAIHEKPKGIVAASFQHSTSREADMQLHTHVLIANVCEREDGTFGTLESKPFFAHKMTAGAIYRTELAASLRSMGFELAEDAKDNFKIVGVSNEACKQFSKRRDAIEDYLTQQGLRDAKSSAKAALSTRDTKEELCFADKIEDWRKEAKPFGIDAQSIETLRTFKAPETQPPTVEEVLRQLTDTASTFREQDIVRVLAVKAQTAVFDRQALLEEIKASSELLRLTAFDDGQKRFTSREMRALEEGIVAKAVAGKDSTRHQVNEDLVAQGIAKIEAKSGFELNEEQREAVRFITQKTGTVACVEGMAGTGKTTMLEAARVVLESAGMNVHGCALAGKAAQGLQDGAGIQSHTIHSLLLKLEKGEVAFNEKSVVVMDESGMVGSRLYAALLDRIEAAGGKLVLVGDYRQLQPIDAGGMFKQITKAIGSTELVEIRRQKADWHREAVHDLAAGNADKAIQAFADKGLIHVAEERAQAIEAMVKAWHADTTDVKEKLMLAATRFETRVLNEAARELLKADGSIQEDTATRVECADEIEREFCVGDRILFLKNDAQLAVKNGTLGFVREIAFTPEGAPVFTVECDDGEAKTINLERYSDIAHGLCVSVHKSQGATVDTAYMLTNENMGDREWSYVAASRSRHETRIFTTTEEFEELSARMARSRQKDSSLDYEIVQAQSEESEQENASVASTPARSSEAMDVAPLQPNAQGVPLTGAAQGNKLADLKAAFAALWTALNTRADRVKQESNQTVAETHQQPAKPQRETAGLEM